MFENMTTQNVYFGVEPLFPVARGRFAGFLSAHVGPVGPLCWAVAAAWVADKHRYHPPRIMEWTWPTIEAFFSKVRRDIPLHLPQLTSSHFSGTQSSDSDSAEAVLSSPGVKNTFVLKYVRVHNGDARLATRLMLAPDRLLCWQPLPRLAGDVATAARPVATSLAPRRRAESWPEGPVRGISLRRASLCWLS